MKCNVYIVFLFGLGAFINVGNAQVIVCNKAFSSPPEDDCSTESVPSGTGEIPCLVYINDTLSVQLEDPDDNTMTWYRTCHTNATNPTCRAEQKGPHNKPIPVIPAGPNATQQILYSPNYNKGRDYRKSSICRYDVTCDSEHILGYIFNEHVLENSTDLCGAQNKCVDYVKLSYPNVTDEEWLCGHDAELNQTVVVDGHSNMHVEFYANRLEEAKGFSLAVLCYVPGFEPSVRKRQAEGEEARDSGTECVKVSDQKSAPVDSATELRVTIESEYVAEDLDAMDKCGYIIRELETLHYRNEKLRIRRRNGEIVRVAQGIQVLYVSSRIRKSRTFEGSADTRFQGYAELCVSRSGTRAYVLLLGLNPISKPTRDENEVIVQLQRSISRALECNNFNDLYDEEDAREEGVAFVPSVCKCNFKRDQGLDEKAILYGNACNDILRHVACSYQAAIMNTDCVTGRPLENSPPLSADDCRNTRPAGPEPTKPPTKPTNPPSTSTKPATKPTNVPSVPTKPVTSRPSDTTESTERHTTPVTSAPTRVTGSDSATDKN